MIATPLLPQGGRARRVLSSAVVIGSFTTTTANAVRQWGGSRAGIAAATTAAATTAVERMGTATGMPFGRYAYTRALQPQVAHVPAIVPLAWFALGLPARETAHAALGPRSTPATRIALGSAALTAWDLFLDPQMVGEGYWA
ncbi:MAG: carotenoid biosynthesis protein, partial [Acidobacteriota bacterium]